MDATKLGFDDETFDFVFSFAAFEHFSHPDLVLKEAARVVRKNGYIYLSFGPLYMSAFGEHAYRSITVPYCQFLFEKGVINDFTKQKGLSPIDFDSCNGWSVEHYRALWDRQSARLRKLKYEEGYELAHLDLIRKYPSCFKSKTGYFENLVVSWIVALFQKSST